MGYVHRRSVMIAAAVGVLLVLSVVMLPGCSSGGEGSGDTTAAKVAPDFFGTTLDGQQVALSDYSGKPVVVVFMASWCAPCRAEAPEIERFYKDNADRAAVLAVAVSDSEGDIRAFVSESGITFPVMLDGDDAASEYGVIAIPTVVVVDAEGYIAKKLVGGTTADDLSLVVDGLTR